MGCCNPAPHPQSASPATASWIFFTRSALWRRRDHRRGWVPLKGLRARHLSPREAHHDEVPGASRCDHRAGRRSRSVRIQQVAHGDRVRRGLQLVQHRPPISIRERGELLPAGKSTPFQPRTPNHRPPGPLSDLAGKPGKVRFAAGVSGGGPHTDESAHPVVAPDHNVAAAEPSEPYRVTGWRSGAQPQHQERPRRGHRDRR